MTTLPPSSRPLDDAGTWRIIRAARHLTDRSERRGLRLATLLAVLAEVSGAALLALSGYLIARASEQPPVLSLTVAIVCVRGFGMVRAVARYTERLVGHDAVLRSLTRLRTRVFSRAADRSHDGDATTEMLDRSVADVDRIQDVFLRSLVPLAAAMVMGVLSVGVAIVVEPMSGLILGVTFLAVGVVLPMIAQRLGRSIARVRTARRVELVTELAATLDAAPEIVMSGTAEQRRAMMLRHSDALSAAEDRDDRVTALLRAGSESLAGIGMVATVGVVLVAVANGDLDPILTGLLALLALAVSEVLGGMPGAARDLRQSAHAIARVDDALGAAGGEVTEPVSDDAGSALGPDVAVHIHDLRVVRRGRTIIPGFALDIAAGERVALIGPSGVGKSTLADVLVGFVEPEAVTGTITVGGVPLTDLAPDVLRATILHVPQDPYLFDATLRANLQLAAPEAPDARLVEALVAVGAEEWLAGLAEGLDTPLGERGAHCSGGEVQRIGLARAWLATGHRLVLLDEPVSHLPEDAAVAALTAVLDADPTRGALIIAHRAAEASLADRAVLLAPQ